MLNLLHKREIKMSDTESESTNTSISNSDTESVHTADTIEEEENMPDDILDTILSGKVIEGKDIRSKHMLIRGGAQASAVDEEEESEEEEETTWTIKEGTSKKDLLEYIIEWFMYVKEIKKVHWNDPENREKFKGYARRYIAEKLDQAEFVKDPKYDEILDSRRFRKNREEIDSLFTKN